MTQWLLAAEADQIQDFIFRSSRLREVVGGSQILTRFCAEVPQLLMGEERAKETVIVHDGGSFRLLFDSYSNAQKFGDQLAEVYQLATDTTLTVARPVEILNNDFITANKVANTYLREAKRRRQNGTANSHIPYVALCASCGIGLAVTHEPRRQLTNERGQYICQTCRNKAAERIHQQPGSFLLPFLTKIDATDPTQLIWPGKERSQDTQERDPTEDVARYDNRRYVAYLLVDGNNMGKVFGGCDQKQMGDLSEGLTEILRQCLADTTIALKKGVKKIDIDVPVLPLILGGDDLFALLPAPWAIHFAAEFCRQYEEQVTKLVYSLGLPDSQDIPQTMTCGAVVVICKNSYSYRLVYQAGETRLKAAKRLSKMRAKQTNQQYSIVDFEIITGGQLVGDQTGGRYRPTLRPYWVDTSHQALLPTGWGITIDKLLQVRYELRQLPGKRRSQLRNLYRPDSLLDIEAESTWQTKRNMLRQRIKLSTGQESTTIWPDLDGDDGFLRIDRPTDKERWHGAALPDVLDAWDYLLKLNMPRSTYEEA